MAYSLVAEVFVVLSDSIRKDDNIEQAMMLTISMIGRVRNPNGCTLFKDFISHEKTSSSDNRKPLISVFTQKLHL